MSQLKPTPPPAPRRCNKHLYFRVVLERLLRLLALFRPMPHFPLLKNWKGHTCDLGIGARVVIEGPKVVWHPLESSLTIPLPNASTMQTTVQRGLEASCHH